MSTLLEQVDQLLRSDRPLCYTALVETRGSTPQKAGATMIVFHDGTQLGTLGGGHVEADVRQYALQFQSSLPPGHSMDLAVNGPTPSPADTINYSRRKLLTFQMDGENNGLSCGGWIRVLIDPITSSEDRAYFQRLRNELESGRGYTEAVILEPHLAGGGHEGDRFLIDHNGMIAATRVSDRTCAGSTTVIRELKPIAERPRPYIVSGVSYLPHLQRCRLIVVGAGNVGQKIAELAAAVGFEIWVVDDRPDYGNRQRFPMAKQFIVESFQTSLQKIDVDSNTYCVIVTRGHSHDELALRHLAGTQARYIGMLGSRRKINTIFENLTKAGIPHEALARVHAPLGLDIGSRSPEEIAISAVAELIADRNLGRLPGNIRRPGLINADSNGS
jgi:xanthine dehydrogenase accessory factor